jgi:hypothetical protein
VPGVRNQRETTGAKARKKFDPDKQQRRDERPSQNVAGPVVMVMMAGTVVMVVSQKCLPLPLSYKSAMGRARTVVKLPLETPH